MISVELSWMLFLGSISIIVLSAFSIIICKYNKLKEQYDELIHEEVSETKTRQLIHFETKSISHFEALSEFPSYGNADDVPRLVELNTNAALLRLVNQMRASGCIDIRIQPNKYNPDTSVVVVSVDVVGQQ